MATLIDGARYVYVGGNSAKFWEWRLYTNEIGAKSVRLTFRWGRIESAGQTLEEIFDNERFARWKIEKKVAEKLGKGYRLDTAREVASRLTNTSRLTLDVDRMRALVKAPPPAPPPPPQTLEAVRRVRLRD